MAREIAKGMWVVDAAGKVGIANLVKPDGAVEFHQVDEEGFTVLVKFVHVSKLVQARYREIPKARRALSKERFAALGYA